MPFLNKLLGQPVLREAVRQLLKEAEYIDDERRQLGRLPFFHPVMIKLKEGTELYSALTRDVSQTGIGLLHWMPIEPQPISVICHLQGDTILKLTVDVRWCVSCGQGWYISGGEFIEVHPDLN